MSAQSISELNQHHYAAKNRKDLLGMVDLYFFKKNFLLGPGVDRDRLNHAMLFHGILCQDNCEIVNYIEDKIHGRLEEAGCKPRKKKLSYLLKEYCHEFKCSEEEALDCVVWKETQW